MEQSEKVQASNPATKTVTCSNKFKLFLTVSFWGCRVWGMVYFVFHWCIWCLDECENEVGSATFNKKMHIFIRRNSRKFCLFSKISKIKKMQTFSWISSNKKSAVFFLHLVESHTRPRFRSQMEAGSEMVWVPAPAVALSSFWQNLLNIR